MVNNLIENFIKEKHKINLNIIKQRQINQENSLKKVLIN